jgi:hypothetical protein
MYENCGSAINSKPLDAELIRDLAAVLNRHSRENYSNTPDFVLAEYLVNCLRSFETAENLKDELCRDHSAKTESLLELWKEKGISTKLVCEHLNIDYDLERQRVEMEREAGLLIESSIKANGDDLKIKK